MRRLTPTASPRRAAIASVAALVLLACVLAGCTPRGNESVALKPVAQPVYPQVKTNPTIPVTSDVVYGTADGAPLTLDICFPS
ncbi:MAG: hypothetical protein ABI400_04335, partial [Lacisediminihabitans sp.]